MCPITEKKYVQACSDSFIIKLCSSIGECPIVVARLLHNDAVNFGKCSLITVSRCTNISERTVKSYCVWKDD